MAVLLSCNGAFAGPGSRPICRRCAVMAVSPVTNPDIVGYAQTLLLLLNSYGPL
jgi:hypothetical protein